MNIQVPDNTPIIEVIRFAASMGLAIRHVAANELKLEPHSMQAKPQAPSKVVSLDSRRV